jgi:hypothetical protein
VYTGHALATSFLDLEDDENVREYLLDADGKQKRKPTLVHQAIRTTLRDYPDRFSILNGGVVIVAKAAEVDDKARVIKLSRPSIINGSQTRGELKRYLENGGADAAVPNVFFQLIVTDDKDLVAEISIARNFQNDVQSLSIAGRRGQLDELEMAIKKARPNTKLSKSETELPEGGYLDTEKLLQVLFALLPDSLATSISDESGPNKVFTYSQKSKCLKLFQQIWEKREQAPDREIYGFFLDVAPDAWDLYQEWKQHPAFKGCGIRSIDREDGEIMDVPDGIVFPILASLAVFAKKSGKKWGFKIPAELEPRELVSTAKQAYSEIASHNPQLMGKSKACYSSLSRVTSIYAKLVK